MHEISIEKKDTLNSIYLSLLNNYFCEMFTSRKELEEGDFYVTPEGYKVFTEKFHRKRGYCCKNGCKHCPYGCDKKTDTFK